MLKNNNLRICRTLVLREFKFHKARHLLLSLAAALIAGMYVFVFLIGASVKGAYLLAYQYSYGSSSHILYTGMTEHQAQVIAQDPNVKSTVRISTVGTLSDEMMGVRIVKLAVTDRDYAESILSLPTSGRMPENAAEIAMDEFTMDSLGIPAEPGYEFSLQWTDNEGEVRNADFVLSGWWRSPTNYTEACAFITPERADMLLPGYRDESAPTVTLGVNLYQPDDLDVQAQKILESWGISSLDFSTNLGYNAARVDSASDGARPFYAPAIVVFISGILMIYSILRVSAGQDRHYFAGLKAIGMTPRQILRIFIGRATWSTLTGLLPGLLAGAAFYFLFVPSLISGFEKHPAYYLMDWPPFAAAALCCWLTVLPACLLPAVRLVRLTPAQAMSGGRCLPGSGKRSGEGSDSGLMTLSRLALRSLKQGAGRTLLSACTILAAMVLLCGNWIRFVSYEESVYLSAYSPWDYSIADGSAQISSQRYNENNRGITEEMVTLLRSRPETAAVSGLKSRELELQASPELKEILTNFYNNRDEESGVPRRELMDYLPEWITGLERLERTGEYTAVILGVEEAFLDYVVESYPVIDGTFDARQFARGDDILTGGAFAEELSTLPAGAELELAGQTFRIMASVVGDSTMLSGGNSPGAAFNLMYYVPVETFDQLFPGQAYRQLAVDIDLNQQEGFEAFLNEYEQGVNRGISVRSRSEYQEKFEEARLNEVFIDLLTGAVLLGIGIINFINSLAVGTLHRRKEFAIYESLGVTAGELKWLLALEGIYHAALLVFLVVPATFLITWFGMPVVFAGMNTWCMVYRYTLAPMWLTLPILLLLAVIVPQICLRLVRRGSITERLSFVGRAKNLPFSK